MHEANNGQTDILTSPAIDFFGFLFNSVGGTLPNSFAFTSCQTFESDCTTPITQVGVNNVWEDPSLFTEHIKFDFKTDIVVP